MENIITKYFVMDLNTTEQCASMEDAEDKAAWWMSCGCVDDADDETILRWCNTPDMGLESGDVRIYEVSHTQVEWDAMIEECQDDYWPEKAFLKRVIDEEDPVKVLSGKAQIEAEARKRGLI